MRTAFRIATLTIELIERRKYSFDRAFNLAVKKVERIELSTAYRLAWKTLTKYMLADYILKRTIGNNIPLRRKCAFRVGFFLTYYEHMDLEILKRVSGGLLPNRLIGILRRIRKENESNLLPEGPEYFTLAVKYSHPLWLVHKLKQMYRDKLEDILKANERRIVWLRVNRFKADEERVERLLVNDGVAFTRDKDVPGLYRIDDSRVVPSDLEVVKRDLVIVQDKASVMVVHALRPERDELILDACAAPGMKTQLILEMLEGSGRVLALDISKMRMINMKHIVRRFCNDTINLDILITDSSMVNLTRKLDKVLIDAPCTNSGAISSDPALRIILRDITRTEIKRLRDIQVRILLNCLRYAGKYAIYSTCSILPEECEEVVRYAKRLGYEIGSVKLNVGLRGFGIDDIAKKSIRLLPIHGTLGFFISRIEA